MQLLDLHQARRAVVFRPGAAVKFLQGADAVTDYRFGPKRLHHLFCPTCGVGSFSSGQGPDGQDTFAINVRCLDDIDVAKLTPMPFDGKSL